MIAINLTVFPLTIPSWTDVSSKEVALKYFFEIDIID